MNQNEAEIFVKALFHDIWEGHNINQFHQYYHQEIETNLGGKSISFNEIKMHADNMKTDWQNTKVVFKDIISNNDNKIAVRFNMSGIKNNEAISFEMMGIYEMKDHKLFRIFGLSNPPMIYPNSQ